MSAPKFFDRVQETSATTGTGTYTLGGAVTGFTTFGAVLADGDSCYYGAHGVDVTGNPNGGWEIGRGTVGGGGTTLTRDSILSSSNAGAAVNWAAGTRRIFVTHPASVSVAPHVPFLGVLANLPGLKALQPTIVSGGAGTYDMYTVPAGRRAICYGVAAFNNATGGTVSCSTRVKIGGSYFRLATSLNVSNNSVSHLPAGGYVFEAGETLAVVVANTMTLTSYVFEFDDTAIVRTVKIAGTAAGDATLYTCPAGKWALPLGTPTGQFYPPFQLGAGGNAGLFSSVSSTQTLQTSVVPNGAVLGATHRQSSSVTSSAGASVLFSGSGVPLFPGDLINVNLSAASADSMVALTLAEYPLF